MINEITNTKNILNFETFINPQATTDTFSQKLVRNCIHGHIVILLRYGDNIKTIHWSPFQRRCVGFLGLLLRCLGTEVLTKRQVMTSASLLIRTAIIYWRMLFQCTALPILVGVVKAWWWVYETRYKLWRQYIVTSEIGKYKRRYFLYRHSWIETRGA